MKVSEFVTSFMRKGRNEAPFQPQLSGANRQHGGFLFKVRLAAGSAYEVHASTDLKTWTPIGNGVAASDSLDQIDSEASDFSHRFYRVLSGELLSRNIIGYVSISLPPGYCMIANPLNTSTTSVTGLLPNMPEEMTLSKYDTNLVSLSNNVFKAGKWLKPEDTLTPGEGAIVFNPTNEFKTIHFSGEVLQGKLTNPIPAGFSIRGSMLPLPGRLDADLAFPLNEGDVVHVFNRDQQKYIIYNYPSKEWTNNPPVLAAGESFWVGKTAPANWVQDFTINTAVVPPTA
jgi:hypothetical protein